MRIRSASAASLVLVATPALGQSFLGEWTATAQAPTGPVSETVSVTETEGGYAVAAKLVAPQPGQPEAGPGTDIVLDGDSFSYKRYVGSGPTAFEITYSGVVSGDSFTGMVSMGGFEVPYNGVRNADGD